MATLRVAWKKAVEIPAIVGVYVRRSLHEGGDVGSVDDEQHASGCCLTVGIVRARAEQLQRAALQGHSDELQWPVIVAMPIVGMMQVPIHQVIDVIAVGHGRVPAARAVHVIRVMPLAVVRCALGGIGIRDLDDVLVVVVVVGAVEVPVVQVAHVVAVLYGHVAAVRDRARGVWFSWMSWSMFFSPGLIDAWDLRGREHSL